MLTADNKNSLPTEVNSDQVIKSSGPKKSRLAIDVHSMPRTSEKSLKIWFVLGGAAILVVIGLIAILLI